MELFSCMFGDSSALFAGQRVGDVIEPIIDPNQFGKIGFLSLILEHLIQKGATKLFKHVFSVSKELKGRNVECFTILEFSFKQNLSSVFLNIYTFLC